MLSQVNVREYVAWLFSQAPRSRLRKAGHQSTKAHKRRETVAKLRQFLEREPGLDPVRRQAILENLDYLIQPTVADRYVEYRGSRGDVSYYAKAGHRKWPADDVSERLWAGYWALKQARCPHPYAFLSGQANTSGIGINWTPQHIQSRLKFFQSRGPDAWPGSPWLMGFWLSLDPDNRNKPLPEEQPFRFIWCSPQQTRRPIENLA